MSCNAPKYSVSPICWNKAETNTHNLLSISLVTLSDRSSLIDKNCANPYLIKTTLDESKSLRKGSPFLLFPEAIHLIVLFGNWWQSFGSPDCSTDERHRGGWECSGWTGESTSRCQPVGSYRSKKLIGLWHNLLPAHKRAVLSTAITRTRCIVGLFLPNSAIQVVTQNGTPNKDRSWPKRMTARFVSLRLIWAESAWLVGKWVLSERGLENKHIHKPLRSAEWNLFR